jgi:hypothetical protein
MRSSHLPSRVDIPFPPPLPSPQRTQSADNDTEASDSANDTSHDALEHQPDTTSPFPASETGSQAWKGAVLQDSLARFTAVLAAREKEPEEALEEAQTAGGGGGVADEAFLKRVKVARKRAWEAEKLVGGTMEVFSKGELEGVFKEKVVVGPLKEALKEPVE